MKNSILEHPSTLYYCFSAAFFFISTLCYGVEVTLRPIKWDLGIKIGEFGGHASGSISPDEIPETIKRVDNSYEPTLSFSYYGKYNLVYETTLGICMNTTNITMSKNLADGQFIVGQEDISTRAFPALGENIKYRFAWSLKKFTFAALPFLGLQYSYAKIENKTFISFAPSTTLYQKGIVPQTTNTIVPKTNHLLSLNTGLGVEFIYNNAFGIFFEVFYQYGLYSHYRHDITYQYINQPVQTISMNHRINNYGLNTGLKFYFRKKAE